MLTSAKIEVKKKVKKSFSKNKEVYYVTIKGRCNLTARLKKHTKQKPTESQGEINSPPSFKRFIFLSD